MVSAATAGMAGAFASSILAGKVFVDGAMVFAGPGEPLGAFIAAYVGIFFGHMVSGKTKVDILVTPVVTIGSGCLVGFLIGPPISGFMSWLGSLINWGTEQQPFLMGDYCIGTDGNDPDTADQFGSTWCDPESVRSGSRSRNSRMLL